VQAPFAEAIVERHLAYAARLYGVKVLEEIPALGLRDLGAVLVHFGIDLSPDCWQRLREGGRGECVSFQLSSPLRAFHVLLEPYSQNEHLLTVADVSATVYRPQGWRLLREPLAALTAAGRVYYVNPAFERFFRLSRRDVVGKEAREYPAPFPRALLTSAFSQSSGELEAEGPLYTRFVHEASEGLEHHLEAGLFPILAGGTRLAALVVYRDLSREIRLGEEAVLKLTTAAMAHELRNPAQAVNGFLQLAKRQSDGEILEWLDVAEQEVRRMMRMLEDLLLAARAEEPRRSAVRLREAALEALSTVAMRWPEAEAMVEVVGGDFVVRSDRGYLSTILANLIENALEAEGATAVRVELTPTAVVVRDNGRGLSPEALLHLFEPFFTTKVQGSGLGLYVAKRFADLIGARITAENDGGAVFTVELNGSREDPT
jgi:PAS domain S-box-containing protein